MSAEFGQQKEERDFCLRSARISTCFCGRVPLSFFLPSYSLHAVSCLFALFFCRFDIYTFIIAVKWTFASEIYSLARRKKFSRRTTWIHYFIYVYTSDNKTDIRQAWLVFINLLFTRTVVLETSEHAVCLYIICRHIRKVRDCDWRNKRNNLFVGIIILA